MGSLLSEREKDREKERRKKTLSHYILELFDIGNLRYPGNADGDRTSVPLPSGDTGNHH